MGTGRQHVEVYCEAFGKVLREITGQDTCGETGTAHANRPIVAWKQPGIAILDSFPPCVWPASLCQAEMGPILVVVGDILVHQRRFRWRSFTTITWPSKSRRQLPTKRSAIPFCHGL